MTFFSAVRLRTVVLGAALAVGVLAVTGWGAGRLLGQRAFPAASRPPGEAAGHTVVVDPGHGGPDPGAVGGAGTLEKDVVLAVGLELARYLSRAGVRVVLTRNGDTRLVDESGSLKRRQVEDLNLRARRAHEVSASVLVSIHANSFPSPRWSGAQTFYQVGEEESRRLAEAIQAQLVRRLPPNRRVARPADYRVLRESRMPAVVVELGFLSNPDEEVRLRDPAYQGRLAEAIFHGIMDYLSALRGR
ncbi:N-acetylmuramoyl-L-alanine amidase [Limnochorda pilosa]|uniref:Cell wall hydrolase/autolysin n=1 Tax=Limnochorda pilosa TaxID=1555112 RepID=A0A0K2SIX8_LIMPI|nr:N-acetylmuramoyl-L-alanine amidase [Limnochorda pilosa]BAS27081.1 cell wall hydrolase/autolysin [Limnochorda pilosa]